MKCITAYDYKIKSTLGTNPVSLISLTLGVKKGVRADFTLKGSVFYSNYFYDILYP